MKGKKLLVGILSAAMVIASVAFTAFAEDTSIAKIGDTGYVTLKEAITEAKNGETVTLLSDASGDGIEIGEGKDITIDFGGFTYTVAANLVGSSGTKTNAFRFLENSTVTLKNGTLKSSVNGTAILIQNYSNLTLENMTLDFKKYLYTAGYTLSCNKGDTTIKGNTQIISPQGKNSITQKKVYALSIYNDATYGSVSLTIDDSMTGTITGNIEISGTTIGESTQKLIIKNGTYTGTIADKRKDKSIDVAVIYGGTFSKDVSDYYAPGCVVEKNANGTKTVLSWTTDTDSGSYKSGNDTVGMMRFMFKIEPKGTVKASGIKYIKADDIAAEPTTTGTVNASENLKAFQGDIINIPANENATYFARAYITTDNGTFWSEPVRCSVNWNQFFTNYTGGAQ